MNEMNENENSLTSESFSICINSIFVDFRLLFKTCNQFLEIQKYSVYYTMICILFYPNASI